MPYALHETPSALQGKGIPRHYIRIFIHTFNSVLRRTESETRAFKAAWTKMKEALHKAGYTQDKDGKWHR